MMLRKKWLVGVGAAWFLGTAVARADSAVTPPPPDKAPAPAAAHRGHGVDMWVRHTQDMLQDMKQRLNLTDGQQEAWKAWTGDVMSITRSQTERVEHWQHEHEKRAQAHGMDDHMHMTTPERMEHGLEHMRVEVQRMQDHIALLEKLQVSTKQFYDALDTNQKTIFDLYWQQAYHMGLMLGRQHGMMMDHHGMSMDHHGAPQDAGTAAAH